MISARRCTILELELPTDLLESERVERETGDFSGCLAKGPG